MKRARYKGIPCYFDKANQVLEHKNVFYGLIISVLIFFDKWILIRDNAGIYIEE